MQQGCDQTILVSELLCSYFGVCNGPVSHLLAQAATAVANKLYSVTVVIHLAGIEYTF